NVASALLIPLSNNRRRDRAGHRAVRGRCWFFVSRRPGLDVCLLRRRHSMGTPSGAAFSRPGLAPLALHWLPIGAELEGLGSVVAAHCAAVRGGGLDCVPANANTRRALRS